MMVDLSSNFDFNVKKLSFLYQNYILLALCMLYLHMFSLKGNKRFDWLGAISLLSMLSLLALQAFWLNNTYHLINRQLIDEANMAFEQAYKKEQTYRLPVTAGSNGSYTIQECGNEEIRIIRECPQPDTIVYQNTYGLSMETIINRAFYELHEHIAPLNIHCLSDLFAGGLYEKGIEADFIVEKVNAATGEILATSLTPDKTNPEGKTSHILLLNISETETLQAKLYFTQISFFRRMMGIFGVSVTLLLVTIGCLTAQVVYVRRQRIKKETIDGFTDELLNRIEAVNHHQEPVDLPQTVFHLGQYTFDADKNELCIYDKTITLNKKEDAILFELCSKSGKIVERSALLEKHWGSSGFLYSRSLDTYIAKLRGYLSEDSSVKIITIKGVGYKLAISQNML